VRQLLTALALASALAIPGSARAHDAYSDAESNPLKIISYPVAAAGFALEWIFARPIHFVVSQPSLQRVFNYEPTYNAFDAPDPYLDNPSGPRSGVEPGGQMIVPSGPAD
jgi:hypothetical protein